MLVLHRVIKAYRVETVYLQMVSTEEILLNSIPTLEEHIKTYILSKLDYIRSLQLCKFIMHGRGVGDPLQRALKKDTRFKMNEKFQIILIFLQPSTSSSTVLFLRYFTR